MKNFDLRRFLKKFILLFKKKLISINNIDLLFRHSKNIGKCPKQTRIKYSKGQFQKIKSNFTYRNNKQKKDPFIF